MLADSCPQLRSLELWTPRYSGFCISEAHLTSLAHLSQLTSLTLGLGLGATNVEVEGMLQGLPSPLHLSLCCHPRGTIEITNAILRGRALEGLTILHSKLKDFAPALWELRSLTRLTLHASNLRSLPEHISLLTGLREIDLVENECCSLPAGLAACTNLTSLVMGFGSGMSVLTKLKSLRSLSFTPDDTCTAQEKWTPLMGLTQLRMGMTFFAKCPEIIGMPCLRTLILSECFLSDLPSGAYLSRLTNLHVRDCIFESGVPAALTNAPQLQILQVLNRYYESGIMLSDSDLMILSSLPVLEILVLEKPPELSQREWDDRVALLMRQYTALGHAQPILLSDPDIRARAGT